MLGGADVGRGGAELAARLAQLDGVDELAALVALVAARVLVAAQRARALDEAVGQEAPAALAVQLVHRVLAQEAVGVQLQEHVLSDPAPQQQQKTTQK